MNYLIGKLKAFGTIYLVLDGIDELDIENQTHVLALVDTLLNQTELLVKVFITSRTEEFRIKRALQSHQAFHLSIKTLDEDITLFIKDEVNRIQAPHPLISDPTLKEEVVKALVDGAKGM